MDKNTANVWKLKGRIDSVNAEQIERELSAYAEKTDAEAQVLDAKELEYISSAGLRVLLRLMKKGIRIQMTEVSPVVWEILDVTGFLGMLQAGKALREISVEGCPLIGQGGTAGVYRLDEDTIVKLYYDNVPFKKIEKEKTFTRKAFELGMPCAISFDIVKCGGKYGIVYELIHARTLAEAIAGEPERLEEYASAYGRLGRSIHGLPGDPQIFPETTEQYHEQIERLRAWVDGDAVKRLHGFVDSVPGRGTLIHGDFHLNNVMLQDGEYILIDMADVSCGHPVFELACTWVGLVSICSRGPELTTKMYGLMPDQLLAVWDGFIRGYFGAQEEKERRRIDAMLQPFALLKTVLRGIEAGPVPEAMAAGIAGMVRQRLLPAVEQMDTGIYDLF